MREIKFRAWDKPQKKMFYADRIDFNNSSHDLCSRWQIVAEVMSILFIYTDSCNGILMQYVGLKDKYDKEIYEGDIVKLNDDLIFEIFWKEGCIQIGMNENQGTNHFTQQRANNFEVVGNIYESPHLLNSVLNVKEP